MPTGTLRPMARAKSVTDHYLGKDWRLSARPKTMFDLIEERRAKREQARAEKAKED